MYRTILVTLDATPTDRAIVEHVRSLAQAFGSSVVLLHVATGVPAQWHGEQAGGQEVAQDREYLEQVKAEFDAAGVPAQAALAFGDPVREIVRYVEQNPCDLVAMSTHGHGFVADLVLGTTAFRVQHSISVPVLLLRAR